MSLIGRWVWRNGLTRAHFVESEIGTDVVTHCGRRLTSDKGPFETWVSRSSIRLCEQCR